MKGALLLTIDKNTALDFKNVSTPEAMAAWTVIIGSLFSAALAIKSYIIMPFYRWIVDINNKNKVIASILNGKSLEEWNAENDRKNEAINQILYELKPNGGASTKDAINDIRKLVKGISTDITHIKERQNVGIYLNPSPVFECDNQGDIVTLNKKMLEVLGLTEPEALGMGWTNQIHPEDKPRVLHEWEIAVRSNSEFNCNYRFINKHTHETINIKCTTNITRNDKDEVIYIMGTFEIL